MNDNEIGEIIGIFIVVAIVLVSLVGMVFISNWANGKNCMNKYASFENKYSYWEGCQIKVNNKWIPSSSYYFMEE